jgi:phosphodiester glycosidase
MSRTQRGSYSSRLYGLAAVLSFLAVAAAPAPRKVPSSARPPEKTFRPSDKDARRASRTVQRRSSRSRKRAPAIGYRKVVVAGVPMHVVQVDLRQPQVRIAVATSCRGIGSLDTWSGMVNRTRPTAAVTGTYFCPRTALPVGSILARGRRLYNGSVGTAFVFTLGRGARLVSCRPGIRREWPGADTVLQAGPRLLTRGRRTLWPHAEGFRDPSIFARKHRTALGLTRDRKLLLVAVEKPVLLRTLAAALRRLGAVDAMCLDGGASTGLYYRGKTQVKPGRAMTNLLVVYDSKARYRQQAATLNPYSSRRLHASAGRRRG